MMRTREYEYLTYLVQADNGRFYETIAAFDHDRVAKDYADQCRRANSPRKYRVLERNDNLRELKVIG